MTIPLNSNGHRRRQLRKRVLAEETHCALCGNPVDKTLTGTPGAHYKNCARPNCAGCIPHPMSPEVDEIVPRKHGGSPYARDNCQLTHRQCNQTRGTKTIEEARAIIANKRAHKHVKQRQISASPIW